MTNVKAYVDEERQKYREASKTLGKRQKEALQAVKNDSELLRLHVLLDEFHGCISKSPARCSSLTFANYFR